MSKLSSFVTTLALAVTGCAANNPAPPAGGGVPAPTGEPRMAKGQLPMMGGMKPKAVTALKEMAGKPMVGARSTVSTTGSFELRLEVGVRYTFVITLEDDRMITLFAEDARSSYYPWIPIGNSLAGGLELDFGTLLVVDGFFVSTVVLLDIDWDADGIADFEDGDDDNDGVDDEEDFDIDGDGEEDDYLDADGDGECDLADEDDDGDGLDDIEDDDDDGDGVSDEEDEDADEEIDIDGDGDVDGDGEEGDGEEGDGEEEEEEEEERP